MRDRASDLQIPHSDALTTKPQRLHGERGWSSYDTCPVYCSDQQCRKRNVCRYVDIYKHHAFDIADRHCCSLQDVCHMNFVIDLAHRGVSVAQWLEHRSAESEGCRLDSSWRLRIFSLSHARDKTKKHLSPFLYSKLTISLISIYQLIHCKHKTNTWWFLSKGIAMVYNRWYSRWCCEKIDIWKSYPNVLSNNSQPIQLHSIHDAIEPFICKNYLRQRREFYIDETVLDNYKSPLIIEADFYSSNLVLSCTYFDHAINECEIQTCHKKSITTRHFQEINEVCFLTPFQKAMPKNLASALLENLEENTTESIMVSLALITILLCVVGQVPWLI